MQITCTFRTTREVVAVAAADLEAALRGALPGFVFFTVPLTEDGVACLACGDGPEPAGPRGILITGTHYECLARRLRTFDDELPADLTGVPDRACDEVRLRIPATFAPAGLG